MITNFQILAAWFFALAVGLAVSFALQNHTPERAPQSVDRAPQSMTKTTEYICPMHPDVVDTKPSECPICHMDLVARNELEGDEVSDHCHGATCINAGELKNMNYKSFTVERKPFEKEVALAGRFINNTSVVFLVFERDLNLIKAGARFVGVASAAPGTKIYGKLGAADSMVDPVTRMIRVAGVLDQPAPFALGEMSFDATLKIRLGSRLQVPADAVLHLGRNDIVYVEGSNGRLEKRTVVTGFQSNNFTEIKSGLKEGEVVAADSVFLIDSESKLRGSGD